MKPSFSDYLIDAPTPLILKSLKWNTISEGGIAMWIADMDFAYPPAIRNGLSNMLFDNFLGYPVIPDIYNQTLSKWFLDKHNYLENSFTIIPVTGIMPALACIINTFTKPGDNIIIQPPLYYRISEIIEESKRTLLNNDLIIDDGGMYQIDMNKLSGKEFVTAKVMILCSPHNPVGRVWTIEELKRIGNYCIENNILLVIDEIHCDLILPENKFISFASLPERHLQNTIILNSSTKTFNIAGLRGGNVIVFNEEIKRSLTTSLTLYGVGKVNSMFIAASILGYGHCSDWLNSLIVYIEYNRQYVVNFIKDEIPWMSTFQHQATYLMWIDYRRMNINESELLGKLGTQLLVSIGSVFDKKGSGFFRINIATTFDNIVKAMTILKSKTKPF